MELVEDVLFRGDGRCFRWMERGKQVAVVFIDAEGYIEFSSPESGDVGIYGIGDDCSLQIDQMEIKIGEVKLSKHNR